MNGLNEEDYENKLTNLAVIPSGVGPDCKKKLNNFRYITLKW